VEAVFRWEDCVPHFVHPYKVAIIEALLWINEPLSAGDCVRVLDGVASSSLLSWHLRVLADLGILKSVKREKVRGFIRVYYGLQLPVGEITEAVG